MNFELSEEEKVVRDLAAQIFADHCSPARIRVVEAGDGFDRELWRDLAAAGLVGLCLPERHGGSAMGMVALALIAEQAGRHVAPVPLADTIVTALTLAAHGPDAVAAELVGGVAAGDVVLAAALANAGVNDVTAPAVRAEPTPAGYRLTGFCPAVAGAPHAHRIVVPAVVAGAGPALFLVDPTAPGVTLDRVETTDHQAHAHVTVDTEVAGTARFGDQAALAWLAQRLTVARCAVALGVAEGAVAMTAEHVKTRHQFGRPLATFQAVSHRAADAKITSEAIRVTTFNAAWQLDRRPAADREVLVAAWWAAEGGQQVALAAQHLHGGIGADVDYPVHRYFLWASQVANALGTGSSHLARLGGLIAGAGAGDGSTIEGGR